MIGALLCFAAFGATLLAARRRLVTGVGMLLAVGYAYGLARARFLDGPSHFMFDAALAGLYVAAFTRRRTEEERVRERNALFWMKVLAVIPVLMFIVPLQNPFVQLVGLRAAVAFLPMLVVGARFSAEDFEELGRWFVFLNLVAFGFAVAEFTLGIEPFFPRNAVTETIYRSNDASESGAHRIPATFLSAHAYGGAMVASLPFLAFHWAAKGRDLSARLAAAAAIGVSIVGVFMSATRTPALLLVATVPVIFTARISLRLKAAVALIGGIAFLVVMSGERFQRFTQVSGDAVGGRFRGSNVQLLEIVAEYPLGAGLARGVGTSIPYFLADAAKPQIGVENEFGRIALEQGIAGAALWVAFVLWCLARSSPDDAPERRFGFRLLRVGLSLFWLTGLIGTGLLLAVPQTALLLLGMGIFSVPAKRAAAVPEEAWAAHFGRRTRATS